MGELLLLLGGGRPSPSNCVPPCGSARRWNLTCWPTARRSGCPRRPAIAALQRAARLDEFVQAAARASSASSICGCRTNSTRKRSGFVLRTGVKWKMKNLSVRVTKRGHRGKDKEWRHCGSRHRYQQGRVLRRAEVDGQGFGSWVSATGRRSACARAASSTWRRRRRAISSAVSTAEEMCGEHVRESSSGEWRRGLPRKQQLEVAIGHHEIGERDVRRVQQLIQLPPRPPTATSSTLRPSATVDGSTGATREACSASGWASTSIW